MTKISDEMIEQIDQNNMKALCILKAASKHLQMVMKMQTLVQ